MTKQPTSSADPRRLREFVDKASVVRAGLSDKDLEVRSQYIEFLANSNVRGGRLASLSAVPQFLESLEENERFIAAIRDALLAADSRWRSGSVRVSDALLGSTLEKAGLAQLSEPLSIGNSGLLGLPPTSGFVDDPVCTANGNFVHTELDLSYPARSSALDFTRSYNALASHRDSAFGKGWSSIFDMKVTIIDGAVSVSLVDGAYDEFRTDSQNVFRSILRPQLSLRNIDGKWILKDGVDSQWVFDDSGSLLERGKNRARIRFRREDNRIVQWHEEKSGRTISANWEDGKISSIVSDDGRTVAYIYDNDGHLVAVDRPSGSVSYHLQNGMIDEIHDADGVLVVHNVYDDYGRVARQLSPFLRVSLYSYGDSGITIVADPEGHARNAFVHDQNGALSAMIDAKGYAMRFQYDERGRMVRLVDRRNAEWTLEWDEVHGLPIRRTGPLDHLEEWCWDDRGRIVEYRSPRRSWKMRYQGDFRTPVETFDSGGVLTKTVVGNDDLATRVTDADGVSIELAWDRDGQLSSAIDVYGHVTSCEYGDSGDLVEVKLPSSKRVRFETDDAGRVLKALSPNAEWTYEWSAAGRAIGGVDPYEGPWKATYGAHGKLSQITNGANESTAFSYDDFGNMCEITGPDGRIYRQEHDGLSQLVAATDPAGATWRYGYDPEGALVEICSPLATSKRREVDLLGSMISETDEEGRKWQWHRSKDGLVRRIDGPSACVEHEYDAKGNLLRSKDHSGVVSRFEYSVAGRCLRRRDSIGNDQRYVYDQAGRLAEIVDRTGSIRFTFNVGGEVVSAEDERGRAVSLERDETSGVVTISERSGRRKEITFDLAGKVATLPGEANLQWNEQGRLVAATDALGATTTYVYDAAGRVSGFVDPLGGATSFQRDAAGRVIGESGPSSRDQRLHRCLTGVVKGVETPSTDMVFWHDKSGRLTGFSAKGAINPSIVIELDDESNVAGTQSLKNHRPLTKTKVGSFATDQLGRVVQGGDGSTFRHDVIGQLVEWTSPDGARTTYRYDLGGRLVEEVTEEEIIRYCYDSAGRLVEQETSDWKTQFFYDDFGRRKSEHRSDGRTVDYEWDDAGRLASIRKTEQAKSTVQEWSYDTIGLLRKVGGHEIDWDLTGEWPKVARIDDTWYRLGWTLNAWPKGQLASRLRHDWAGNYEPVLDPWGTSAASGVRVGYRSELCVDDLVWLKARPYDPKTRAFLSPDPLLNPPGKPCAANPYHYAWNDPVTNVDPTGLRPLTQEEFHARMRQEELGIFAAAWETLREDPWGSLALGATIAVGVAFLFIPGGQVAAAGIFIATGISAGFGVATGTFDPRATAIDGLLGGVSAQAGVCAGVVMVHLNAKLGLNRVASTATRVLAGATEGAASSVSNQESVGLPVDPWQVALGAGFGAVGGRPPLALSGKAIDPNTIRFSQKSVNDVAEIITSLRSNGWAGPGIDVVRMPDGGLTTIDNSRVLAARYAELDVRAHVHDYEDGIKRAYMRYRFSKTGEITEWGQAVDRRIAKQKGPFSKKWKMGSPETYWSGN